MKLILNAGRRPANVNSRKLVILAAAGVTLVGLLSPLAANARSSESAVTTPEAPVLVSAAVTKVLVPTQDLSTYKYSSHRKFGILRTVWDISARTDTASFSASTFFFAPGVCAPGGDPCLSQDSPSLGIMRAPGHLAGTTACTRSLTGLRLTLDCPIEMQRYQVPGTYSLGPVSASWTANDGQSPAGEQSYSANVTTRLRNATKLSIAATNMYDTAAGGYKTRITGSLRVLTVSVDPHRNPIGRPIASFKRSSDQSSVAVFYWAPDAPAPKFIGYVGETATGYARTVGYRSSGRFVVKYAGTDRSAPSGASKDASPVVIN